MREVPYPTPAALQDSCRDARQCVPAYGRKGWSRGFPAAGTPEGASPSRSPSASVSFCHGLQPSAGQWRAMGRPRPHRAPFIKIIPSHLAHSNVQKMQKTPLQASLLVESDDAFFIKSPPIGRAHEIRDTASTTLPLRRGRCSRRSGIASRRGRRSFSAPL